VADADEQDDMRRARGGPSTAWDASDGTEASTAAAGTSRPPAFSVLGAAVSSGDPKMMLARAMRFLKVGPGGIACHVIDTHLTLYI
jgi:hypothetical protein